MLKYGKIRSGWLALVLLFLTMYPAHGQDMSMSDVVSAARMNSVKALEARSSFISSYWAYRAYKASLLPSLYFYGNVAQFDKSQNLLQDYQTGEMNYVNSYNMRNMVGLSVDQNIPFTGGTLSLYSDLSRVDQFGSSPYKMWYSQPLSLSYIQPLFTYNRFKWSKLISPKEYEAAKREYLESMEEINLLAVECYFDLMSAKVIYDASVSNCESLDSLLSIARERFMLGSITRDEYLQLELRMLNDSIAINENQVLVRKAQMRLGSLLGLPENSDINPIDDGSVPDVYMDYDFVREKALENSSFKLENEIRVLNAQSAVAKAKAERGITMQLTARFGLNASSGEFTSAYKGLLDQEVVGLSFRIPIFDWGLGRGRVKEAKAAADVVEAQVRQAENDLDIALFTAVGQFNNQRQQCVASGKAKCIAEERLSIVVGRFKSGEATVTELNNARGDYDSARQKYITDLGNFWSYYYTLRKLTLYDYIECADLDVVFEEMAQ